jgi:hypothetical protein
MNVVINIFNITKTERKNNAGFHAFAMKSSI